ncbi:DUF4391 domain-containing protein [uncultured Sunxiuqinia sp.]|uniref:DUF4391 domain-containing protein n=1 Tax=uncultured Sunxiuqinia sp. TaxID=1573825 RepID=UPI00261037EC|nr:DUF4391 domain-containing protein [uncultured Sunxiuqinia sp.]
MFQLPQTTIVNKVIPKNAFDNYTSSKQKRMFIDKVAKIKWENKLSATTINLEGIEVEEIQIFSICLKEKDQIADLIQIIDRSIPYPIIFLVTHGEEAMISLAKKHPHPTNENTAVIDWTFTSAWFDKAENPYQLNLRQSLDFIFNDLCFQLSGKTQSDSSDISALIENVQQIKQLQQKITKLEQEIKRCKQFNRKVELNLELQEYRSILISL